MPNQAESGFRNMREFNVRLGLNRPPGKIRSDQRNNYSLSINRVDVNGFSSVFRLIPTGFSY